MQERGQAGFTLIELMVVVLIVGIISAISIPAYQVQKISGRNAAAQKSLLEGVDAARAYVADNDNYNNFSVSSNGGIFPYSPDLFGTEWVSTNGSRNPSGCTGQAKNCQVGPTANPRNIVFNTQWQNWEYNNDRTTILLCNIGRGDRAYCVLNITVSDPNFKYTTGTKNGQNLPAGLYYSQSEPGSQEQCANASGPPSLQFPGLSSDSPDQAWCGLWTNDYNGIVANKPWQ